MKLEELTSKIKEFHEDEYYSIYIRPEKNDDGGWIINCDTLSIEEDYDEEGEFCSYDGSNSEMEKWANSLGISDEKSLAQLMLVNFRLLIDEFKKLNKNNGEDIELFSKICVISWQMEYLKKFNALNYVKEFNLFDPSKDGWFLNPEELRQEAENWADDCGIDGNEYLPD